MPISPKRTSGKPVGLTQVQVNSAYCDEFTKLAPPLKPSGKKPTPHD